MRTAVTAARGDCPTFQAADEVAAKPVSRRPGRYGVCSLFGDSPKETTMRLFRRAYRTQPLTSPARLRVEQLEDRTTPAVVPPGFTESVFAAGLSAPTAMALAPDGRVFVAEKGGTLRVVQNGAVLPTPFLTVNVDTASERGLDGVALDPNFATNGFVYVYYTSSTGPVNRVSRFTASAGDPNVAQTGSEQILLDNIPSTMGFHNGGALVFGGDGKLFVGVGDSGVSSNAQSLSTYAGKVLRINPDGTIPGDNPTTIAGLGAVPAATRAIWAAGLRNPFTMAVQPGTGQLFINDVGQSAFEEVDAGTAGANYGWPTTEGDFNQASFPNFTRPLYAYAHGTGPLQGNSIAGGAFYNPTSASFPAGFVGDYFFGDFVAGRIFVRDAATGAVSVFANPTAGGGVVDLDVLPDGRLLCLSINTGKIFQIAATPTPAAARVIAVGSGAGAPGLVAALNTDGSTRFVVNPFPGYTGGFSVATGDVTGDHVEDVIAALGPGAPPVVVVYDGATGQLVSAFVAFAPGLTTGLTVAAGDVNADGRAEVVVGTATGLSVVGVFDGLTGALGTIFLAFPGFAGGVNVAAGDLDGDGRAEVIAGAASGVSAVGTYDGQTGTPRTLFLAFGALPVGVNVGYLDGEILVGTAAGAPVVATFDAAGQARLAFLALPPPFAGGARVAGEGDTILAGVGPVLLGFERGAGALTLAEYGFGVPLPGGVFVG
jgi:glucose/arabinose dehydrogenase